MTWNGNLVLAMFISSVYLRDVPNMSLRDKAVICLLILQYIDLYVKTELDLIWVNQQLKKMELERYKEDENRQMALGGSGTTERNWSSDD